MSISTNNGLFSEGAYQWALNEMGKNKIQKPVSIDFKSMFFELRARLACDMKCCIFESEINPKSMPILMLQSISGGKYHVLFYPLDRERFDEDKADHMKSIVIELFKMNGRMCYHEEICRKNASPPMIMIYDDSSQ